MKLFPLVVVALLVGAPPSGAQERRTAFVPTVHGFNFDNTFQNDFIREFDVRTGGLCGGMVYAAFDYYNAKLPIPSQDWRPATNTRLHDYIYDRQVTSLTENLDKWIEVGLNPDGARNAEFFRWGLQGTRGGRLEELRRFIDRGLPVPLGLQSYGGDDRPGNHQVLAIGYDLGGYRGDLGPNQEKLRIFIYDPNYNNEVVTLIPDHTLQGYRYLERPTRLWRTYFVDAKYAAKRPPALPPRPADRTDGLVRELLVHFRTGTDDLRGGNDNADVTVFFRDGTSQRFPNINDGRRWLERYDQTVSLILATPRRPADIVRLQVDTNFGGGVGGDNWNVDMLSVEFRGGGIRGEAFRRQGAPLVRFTGQTRRYSADLRAPTAPRPTDALVREIMLDLQTGGDDLRGGNDNLDVTIAIQGGTPVVQRNVNGSTRWADRTWNTVTIVLPTPIPLDRIGDITLAITSRGGMGGDNWNLEAATIRAVIGGEHRTIFEQKGTPLRRFTGDQPRFILRPAGG